MLTPLKREHAFQVARIHLESLADDFLPSMGVGFLEAFYKGIIGKDKIFGFVETERGKVVGFIVGTNNMKIFFRQALLGNFFRISYFSLIGILKKPSLIKKVFETFLYPKKEVGPKAELVIVAILKKWRGQGIGKKLIKNLEKKFKEIKVKRYKLTVHADKKAVFFYEKLGFSRVYSFSLYDKMWYVYEKRLL